MPDVPLNAIQVDLGADFRIPAGVVEDLTDGVMRLEWTAVVPSFPPDPTAARSAKTRSVGTKSYKLIEKRKK